MAQVLYKAEHRFCGDVLPWTKTGGNDVEHVNGVLTVTMRRTTVILTDHDHHDDRYDYNDFGDTDDAAYALWRRMRR